MKESASLPGKGAAVKRDWTQGSITRNLISLAWPMLISNSINTLGPAVDMIWVGKLGENAIAAVGVSGIIVGVVTSLFFGLFTGTQALIARFVGAKDEANANRVAQQAYVIAFVFAIFIALIGIFLPEPILRIFKVSPAVIDEGVAYLRLQLMGMLTMGLLQVSQSIMQASGDAMNPLKISVTYRLLQIVLSPALIFGWGFLPRLEVSGAALSNVIAQGLGATIALWILFSHRTRISITFRNFHIDTNIIWRTVLIGIPSSTTFVLISFTELVMTRFISAFGTAAIASQMMAQRVDQIVQNLSGGLGVASGVLGGQNMGAGKPERAQKGAWLAVLMATGISFICVAIIWLWIPSILRIFNTDPVLVETASNFLRIQTVGYLVWGPVVVISLFLNGVGDTLVPLLANISTMALVQVTLAYVYPKVTDLGVYGIRWAVVTGVVIRAIIYLVYLKGGRWKKRRILGH